jgi:3-oxoacyl-(acyl-carrier-protein) synthase
MRLDRPLYLHGLWGYPTPEAVLPEPARGWTFVGDFPVRPIGSEVAPSAQSLLDKLLGAIPPSAYPIPPGAVYLGSARGEMAALLSIYNRWQGGQKEGLRALPETTAGALSSRVAERLHSCGPAITVSQTCISGLVALHQASLHAHATGELIGFGAVEAPLHPLLIESFGYLRLASRRKQFPYTLPFQENTVALSEGVVLGFVSLHPSPWQIERVVVHTRQSGRTTFTGLAEEAFPLLLKDLTETPPQAVILHAPGTRKGDMTELAAVEAVWGRLPVLTIKPLIGHSIGASGLLSLLWGQWLLTHQCWLYNTESLRLSPPDWPTFPCETDEGLVRRLPPEKPLRRLAILGAGFGGGVAGVILRYAPL